MKTQVAIIGGGPAGSALAFYLALRPRAEGAGGLAPAAA